MIRSHFAGGVSEQSDMQKAVFKGWCKESRCLIFGGACVYIHTSCMHSEGFDETALMQRFCLAGWLYDKYNNLMRWMLDNRNGW